MEQIKLAVFDSGDGLELAGCHLAVGVSVGKKYAFRRSNSESPKLLPYCLSNYIMGS